MFRTKLAHEGGESQAAFGESQPPALVRGEEIRGTDARRLTIA